MNVPWEINELVVQATIDNVIKVKVCKVLCGTKCYVYCLSDSDNTL